MILFFTQNEVDSDRYLHYCYRYYRNIMLSRGIDLGEEPAIIRIEGEKPRYQSDEVYFNISHSHGVTVLAMSHSEVGIDIEKVRKVDFAKFTFIEAEDERDFFEKWTERESYVKYTGEGIKAIKREIPDDVMIEHFDVFGDYHVAVCAEPQSVIAYELALDDEY